MPAALFSPTAIPTQQEGAQGRGSWRMRKGGIKGTPCAARAVERTADSLPQTQPRTLPKEMHYGIARSALLGPFLVGLVHGQQLATLRLLPRALDDRAARVELLREVALRFPSATLVPAAGGSEMDALLEQLRLVLDGAPRDPAVASTLAGLLERLDLSTGSATQQATWRALLRIPLGRTTSYASLAKDAGLPPSASRAVANACGSNPLAVLVPCHRVLRSDGSLGGYHWGLQAKKLLLRKEGVVLPE